MKIALTGGIACGKSTLAKFLAELGIRVLDADDVVHALEASGGEAVEPIRARFGDGVIARDGGVDRKALADVVFADPSARRELEDLLFPRVRRILLDFASQSDATALHISVIPLLFESHWESDYDIIIAIASPERIQIERMMKTRGYTRAQAEARLAAQMPVAEKAARADFAVVNDSTPTHLKDEAQRLVSWLKERIEHEH
ncbi:MAG: dephospho-CoA kinase [Kiritimatiellae bacterium]|nr:dephospho-CoA kinase [Kiritimatiellia bacterium]